MDNQDIISIVLVLTAVASYINYRYIRLPQAVGMTLITVVLSLSILALSLLGLDFRDEAQFILTQINFHETILKGMLSYLLFAGSLHINMLELAKYRGVVLSLATVGVLISTCLVSIMLYGMVQLIGIALPFVYCLVFGALISPTDPIAALAILKNIHAPKSLEMKIAGEALFNDGMAIVVFLMMVSLATGQHTELGQVNPVMLFLWQVVGGVVLGMISGGVVSHYMRRIANFEVACLMTLAMTSAAYSVAHQIHVSGPIVMVVAGLLVGHMMRSGHMLEATVNRIDGFWTLLDEVLNSVLFVLIGLEILGLTISSDALMLSGAAIIIVLIARYLSIFIPCTLLRTFKTFSPLLFILTWGGMRGGVSIALALSMPYTPERALILTVTYAVVLFSILVQGITIGPITKKILARLPSDDSRATY